MNKYLYLLKNIGLLTLSSFATKLLSFFLVPLYTNVLTTSEYGTFDLFNVTIGVLLPILTLNIQEAVIRFALDGKYNKKAILSVATRYLIISNVIIFVALGINFMFDLNPIISNYSFYFFLMFLSQSLVGVVTMYAQGIGEVTQLSISSVIASFVTISLNILFLVVFDLGITGYFLANILGPFIQSLFLIIRTELWSKIDLSNSYRAEKKEMVKYSKPLIANSIGWWINSVSDRYIVVLFCGLSVNGIYSIASKIPSILNIFQSIFNQAWTLSAVRDFDPEDSNGFFSTIYNTYNFSMTILCSGIILFDKVLANFLYSKDFYAAWRYVPWLTIAVVFGAMSGFIGGLFSAVKDSKVFAKSTLYGAAINLILNLLLVPFLGAMGAAFATAISYLTVWFIRYWQSRKYIKLKINLLKDLSAYSLLFLQAFLLILDSGISNILVFVIFVTISFMYITNIKDLLYRLRRKLISHVK